MVFSTYFASGVELVKVDYRLYVFYVANYAVFGEAYLGQGNSPCSGNKRLAVLDWKGKAHKAEIITGAMTSLLDQARWAGPPCSAPQKQSIHRLLCHLGCRSCLKSIASGIVPTLGSALTSGKPSGQIEMPAAGVNGMNHLSKNNSTTMRDY